MRVAVREARASAPDCGNWRRYGVTATWDPPYEGDCVAEKRGWGGSTVQYWLGSLALAEKQQHFRPRPQRTRTVFGGLRLNCALCNRTGFTKKKAQEGSCLP